MVKVKKLIIFLIILLLSSFIFIPFNVKAYTNITVSDISIGGSEFMSDTMFGFALVVGLITVMNYIGIKLRFLMLSLFAFLSMFFAIGLLWQNDNVYITLMICMVLSNIALLVYGFTKD